MSDRRIIYSVDTLFKQLKNNTLSFGGVQIIMGGDWRQTLPIVDGVKGFGVTNFVIKNTELWKSIEKFKLTQNKRAQEDPQYAKRILAIGDGTNYIDEKRRMVLIPNKNIERRSDRALADWVFPNVNLMNNMTKNSALLTVDNKTALRLNEVILDKLDSPCREFLSLDTPDKDNGMAVDAGVFFPQVFARCDRRRQRGRIGGGGDDIAVAVPSQPDEDKYEEQGSAVKDVAGHALGHDFAHCESFPWRFQVGPLWAWTGMVALTKVKRPGFVAAFQSGKMFQPRAGECGQG